MIFINEVNMLIDHRFMLIMKKISISVNWRQNFDWNTWLSMTMNSLTRIFELVSDGNLIFNTQYLLSKKVPNFLMSFKKTIHATYIISCHMIVIVRMENIKLFYLQIQFKNKNKIEETIVYMLFEAFT